ncbi:chromate efflux transporter [Bacillus kwashiorkori]|uniref:chromate efflux transporter n=1 Tax=Bacillus kwashiorkori TaxID=1522318 RepID=UPI0007867335|nr:chromate efflux transporter [Bacillus kwashiorkori]
MSKKIRTYIEILLISLRLGLTSFGGPIAHLGYFQNEYVKRKKWLDERTYADLIALCQFLPGPASSQVGISIGMIRGGLFGGVLSWFGFTIPSVIALLIFALIMQGFDGHQLPGWINGLKIVAVAVVAHAVYGMAVKLTPDRTRITIAIITAIILLMYPNAIVQFAIIIVAGIIGYLLFKQKENEESPVLTLTFGKKLGIVSLATFFLLLFGLPVYRSLFPSFSASIFDVFYRVGSIVFGGGHVVLPLLEREVVPTGWITAEGFLAGYGATQAVPGPLFTFSAYIGAVAGGVPTGLLATVAMFLPSFLLVIGVLPFWNQIRGNMKFRAALTGINAAVVGLLLAALYHPVFTSAISGPLEFSLALAAFALLMYWKLPPWVVVLCCALAGQILL